MKKGFDISAWQEAENGTPYYDECLCNKLKKKVMNL